MTANTPPPLPPVYVYGSAPRAPIDRPGVQTSEFWLAILATVAVNYQGLNIGGTTQEMVGQIIALVGTALVSMGYTKSRAQTKQTAAARDGAQEGQQ